jgi:putative tryptophan/tyrosine transport system substrate-binding protein
VNFYDVGRRLSRYVRRIMAGGRAADLPVQIHDEVQLVINLRVAKELGITVPQAVLIRAHQVIH